MRDFISLFAGAGGLDIGLEAAGWNCRYASDIDDAAVATMKANQSARTLIKGRPVFDGTFIEKADVRGLTGKDILGSIGARRGDIPLLAGGPPCQSWSSAGHQLGFQDPRGRLWSDFVRIADELDVRYMLFENVRGLLTARGEDGVPGSALDTIRSKLLEVGFHTSVSLLNAADYGVPQRRVRLFIIGYRSGDEPVFPLPTHAKMPGNDDVDRRPWVSMREALGEIAPVSDGEIIRPSGKLRGELEQLEPGSGVKSMGKPEATRPGGHWGYKQGAFMADLSLPGRTVTAGAQQDWVRDPQHGVRRLAPRECAALQTFPNDYIWPDKLADQYRVIGNSVPPALAAVVGDSLLSHADKATSAPSKISRVLSPLDVRLQAAIAYTKREEMRKRSFPARRALQTQDAHGGRLKMPSPEIRELNARNAAIARDIYLASRSPQAGADAWNHALREARKVVASALRASNYLRSPEQALVQSGIHMMTFRQLLAPPVSQDQFDLLCPSWSKRTEHPDRRMTPAAAADAASVVLQWLHTTAAPWLQYGRAPTRAEVRGVLNRASFFMAAQRIQTAQRGSLSGGQEGAVVALLEELGWVRRPSRLIDTRAAVDPKTFMHKTRFATRTTAPQEVDIACGLQGTVVAAIECKVTNDQTNSIKRVNDVLKKASAWHDHWGSFVETVAILQGVIAAKDVDRLTDANVHVFWSHDLAAFKDWISKRV